METQELAEIIRNSILTQRIEEQESDLSDAIFADVSLQFALDALNKLWLGNPPETFLNNYQQILENRYRRLTDEDSGEFGSGRDALGTLLVKIEDIRKTLTQRGSSYPLNSMDY